MERKMLTGQERIEAMHRKAAEIETRQRMVRANVIGAVSAVASLVLIIALSINMPLLMNGVSGGEESEYSGSILADSPVLGFVVIGIIAFILGALVTVLCYRLRKYNEEFGKEGRK
ncbi:MAG: hypothetical protein IJH43_04605 [Mogibacterium sp.]|nr:hypothetical protein [Mogibacterium sp.]